VGTRSSWGPGRPDFKHVRDDLLHSLGLDKNNSADDSLLTHGLGLILSHDPKLLDKKNKQLGLAGMPELPTDSLMSDLGKAEIQMESSEQLIRAVNITLAESREQMQQSLNDVMAMSDALQPKLVKAVHEARETRMALTSEFNAALAIMKDCRLFLLHADHREELARLEAFVGLCERIKSLRDNGILDAVGDIVVRLALKEESHA
jgi:hypothetical protein